jgi:dihydrofolate synthase/folylpolyglutamate synthase
VAGTKGKGSTVAILEALLSPDFRTISFTSPHLVSFKERVRLGGILMDDSVWQTGFEVIANAIEKVPAVKLTYFEFTFVFFLWAARELSCDVHLVEAGLGGRWDATNVLQNTIAVLTPVDYDHTHILGKTLTEISADKGGIIKPDSLVVVGKQQEEAEQVYSEIISAQGARAWRLGKEFWIESEQNSNFAYCEPDYRLKVLTLPLTGLHQKQNAAVAIKTSRLIYPGIIADSVRTTLSKILIPGRQQLLAGNPDVLLDVAHNPASFAVLADTLRARHRDKNILAVIGMAKDKDAKGSLAHLRGLVRNVLIVQLSNPRSYSVPDLMSIADEVGLCSIRVQSQEEAFARLHQTEDHDLGLVAGSFYLAGDYLQWRERAGIT